MGERSVETYISVDVETAGPHPRDFAMLSIGACVVGAPETGFYVELKPTTDAVVESALAVSKLSMAELTENGLDPRDALLRFEEWLASVVPEGSAPVFVAFNAAFDWMFVTDYFERFLGRNPFGHAALDIKAFYMGMAGVTWAQTSMRNLSPRYLGGRYLSHNALGDAQDQAELFSLLLTEAGAARKH
jgi:ribonuclease T